MQLPNPIVNYLQGIFYSFDKNTCVNLAKFFENLTHDSFTRCLHKAFNWHDVLLKIAFKLFNISGGYLIIDEHIVTKQYAQKIESIHFFKSPILKRIVKGYCLVVMCWSNGIICIPIAFEIWEKGKVRKTEIAQQLLAKAYDLGIHPIAVLFDSYYSNKKFLKQIISYGWIFCTQVKSNRLFNGRGIKKRYRLPYWTRTGYLTGGIRVVVAKHGRKYYCTNDLNLGHQEIRSLYKKRWPIEEIFRFANQKLGISECQSIARTAQEAHFTMCFIAYTILQKESQIRQKTDYEIKRELSFQRSKFKLFTWDLLLC